MKRKISSIVTLFLTMVLSVCFFACQKNKFDAAAAVVTYDETATVTYVATETITYNGTEKVIFIGLPKTNLSNYSFLDIMEGLQEAGKITYTEAEGMISSINGETNPVDGSKCWMLYTSDEEISTTEFGALTYEGETYGQAAFGAKDLKVKASEVYLWWYQSF